MLQTLALKHLASKRPLSSWQEEEATGGGGIVQINRGRWLCPLAVARGGDRRRRLLRPRDVVLAPDVEYHLREIMQVRPRPPCLDLVLIPSP